MFDGGWVFKDTKQNIDTMEKTVDNSDGVKVNLDEVANKFEEMFSDDFQENSQIEPVRAGDTAEKWKDTKSTTMKEQVEPGIAIEKIFEEMFSDDFETISGEVQDFDENVEITEKVEKQPEISDDSVDVRNCPIENGMWDGTRGNSTWIPNPDYVPQKDNPEKKTFGEILEKHGIKGIVFKDGEADFSEVSRGTVEIKYFSTHRDDNFERADIELAKQKGCTPREVAQWRRENGYTWHECTDMKTMQKVPKVIHNNVSHRGGVSKMKEELSKEEGGINNENNFR